MALVLCVYPVNNIGPEMMTLEESSMIHTLEPGNALNVHLAMNQVLSVELVLTLVCTFSVLNVWKGLPILIHMEMHHARSARSVQRMKKHLDSAQRKRIQRHA